MVLARRRGPLIRRVGMTVRRGGSRGAGWRADPAETGELEAEYSGHEEPAERHPLGPTAKSLSGDMTDDADS